MTPPDYTPIFKRLPLVLGMCGAVVMGGFSAPVAYGQELLSKPKNKGYPDLQERLKLRKERALKDFIEKENRRRKSLGLPTLEEEEEKRQAIIKSNEEKLNALRMAKERTKTRKKALAKSEKRLDSNVLGRFSQQNIYRLGKLYVLSPWAPETRKGDQTALLYMTIVNPTDTEDKLVNITSRDVTRKIEARVSNIPGTMKGLTPVEDLMIPPRSSVQFNVGGMHFSMLSMIKVLEPEDTFHVLLQFKKNGNGLVRAVVTNKQDIDPYPIAPKLVESLFDGTYDKKRVIEEEPTPAKKNTPKNGDVRAGQKPPAGDKADDKDKNKANDKAEKDAPKAGEKPAEQPEQQGKKPADKKPVDGNKPAPK